jgi:putative transposase
VHLLVTYPPTVAVSTLVNRLKGASSRRLRHVHPDIATRYRRGLLWSSSSFGVSCGGAPLSTIKRYIESQQAPHAAFPVRKAGEMTRSPA